MKKFYIFAIILIIFSLVIWVSTSGDAKDINTFILVGMKFSEVKDNFSDNYTTTNTAENRITYSFLGKNNNLSQFAVKNDIIEVVEVYNVFKNLDDALSLYTELCIRIVTEEKCNLLRAYNSTMEFSKGKVIIRVEQLPTNYGYLVKFTAFAE